MNNYLKMTLLGKRNLTSVNFSPWLPQRCKKTWYILSRETEKFVGFILKCCKNVKKMTNEHVHLK